MKRSTSDGESQTKRKRRGSTSTSVSDIRSTLKRIADSSPNPEMVHDVFHLDLAAVAITPEAATMVRIPIKYADTQSDIVAKQFSKEFIERFMNSFFISVAQETGFCLNGSTIEVDGCFNKNKTSAYVCDINTKFGVYGRERPKYDMCVAPEHAKRFFTALCNGSIEAVSSSDSPYSMLSVLHALCTVSKHKADSKWEILEDCLFDEIM